MKSAQHRTHSNTVGAGVPEAVDSLSAEQLCLTARLRARPEKIYIADMKHPPSRRRAVVQRLAVFLLLLLAAALAAPRPAAAAATPFQGDEHAAARLITAVQATGSAAGLDAGLEIRLAPGWHAYWRTPGDAGVAPLISWQGSENLAGAEISWPAPQRFSLDGLETAGYEGDVVLPIAIKLAHPGERTTLRADLTYAACKEICIPYHAAFTLSLPPGLALPGPEAALIAAARNRIPGDLAAAGLRLLAAAVAPAKGGSVLSVRLQSLAGSFHTPDVFLEGPATGSPGRPQVTLAAAGHLADIRIPIRGADLAAAPAGAKRAPLRLTIVDQGRAAEAEISPTLGALPPLEEARLPLSILGLALAGGLILNFMPCVLPVLSLKLLAFVREAGAPRRQARLNVLATAAGVISSFLVLALILIALKQAGAAIGWGIQFQTPWFLAGMALLTTVFAASLWDLLVIGLPPRLLAALGAARSESRLADAFLVGAFATLLAASCSAPFVGTAIGFALARGPVEIFAVFAALGIGMAAPFLLVAIRPSLVAWLPRPGPWMFWLRRALGLGLLGTAAWLLSVLAGEAGTRAALLAGAGLSALLLLQALRSFGPLGKGARKAAGLGVLAVAALVVLAPSFGMQARERDPSGPEAQAGPWQKFAQSALDAALAQKKIVFVDVSAAWCLICKANELAVLNRSPVAERLNAPDVVRLRADWTTPDPVVTQYLQSFGRYGVPLDVVYGPGAPQGIALPELLRPADVLAALERAAQ